MPGERAVSGRPAPRPRAGFTENRPRLTHAYALAISAALTLIPSVALAQAAPAPQPARAVPPSWSQFAGLVKFRLEEALGARGGDAALVREAIAGAGGALIVRVWTASDGRVRQIAEGRDVGEVPPSDMAQSIVLKLRSGG
jgi:hypothetical protein